MNLNQYLADKYIELNQFYTWFNNHYSSTVGMTKEELDAEFIRFCKEKDKSVIIISNPR